MVSLSDYIIKTISGIDLIPSHLDLVGVEPVLYQYPDRYFLLSSGITTLKSGYDFILIDTPPFLGQFVLNAMIAADRLILVFSPDTFALAGYNHLLLIKDDISEMLGKSVRIDMAILNRWPQSSDSKDTILDKIYTFIGKKKEDKYELGREIRDLLEKRVRVEIPEVVTIREGTHISQSLKQGIPLSILAPDDPTMAGFREASGIIDKWR